MPDPQLQAIVEKMVAAGEPEDHIALVIQHYKPPAVAPEAAPEAPGRFAGYKRLGDAVVSAGKTAINHPVQSLAMLGGIAAAPLTGATSIPAAMAATGLGAAGGAGLGSIANALRGGEQGPRTAGDVAKTMATEGGLGAIGEGSGRAVMKGAELAGRGLYRAALLPINQILGKYGDVVKTGIQEAIPVSKGGAAKATKLRLARSADKADALKLADERVTFRAKGVADDARDVLGVKARELDVAGEGNPSDVFERRLQTFEAKNPDGALTPSRLEGVKRTLDDRNGGAYMKLRKREPLTPKEQARIELTQAASRAQESAIPGYREMNKGIMDASGLERAIQRRTSGSGGNQGLENAMTMLGGVSALPARIAMLPPVLSRVGMGVHRAGQVPFNDMLKTALIAALGGGNDEQ
jgi:hypothetical protein